MIDDNATPKPRTDVDFNSLSPSPTPEQYFLLSRLDGRLTVGELCKISGIGRQNTLEALESLARAGAIEVPGLDVSDASTQGASSSAADLTDTRPAQSAGGGSSWVGQTDSASKSSQPASPAGEGGSRPSQRPGPNFPTPLEQFDVDSRLLELGVPLDVDKRREVVCMHDQLAEMSFYDLFGVSSDASRGAIKKAYFRMSKRYHPDKFFRKDMDDFGPMLETIFKEITKAYRTLSNDDQRKQYDAELDAPRRSDPAAGGSAADASEPTAGSTGLSESSTSEPDKHKAAALVLRRRAQKLHEAGRHDQAAGEFRKALALNRDGQLAVRVAKLFLDEAGLAEEASSFARAALKLNGDVVAARFVLGRANEVLDAAEAAAEQYRRVLKEAPDHAAAHRRLEKLNTQ